MYTKKDIKKFDELLEQTEQKGFNNYNRNIARLEINNFLTKFTETEQTEMAKKIGKKCIE